MTIKHFLRNTPKCPAVRKVCVRLENDTSLKSFFQSYREKKCMILDAATAGTALYWSDVPASGACNSDRCWKYADHERADYLIFLPVIPERSIPII